ncbi:MAG: FMN-binding protein, partial [Eubacteriales bacterium]|nr:FMN-binding protein [Eubacteriales bacterium]
VVTFAAGVGGRARLGGLCGGGPGRPDGGQVDAVSGATISSRAVTGAVDTALAYYEEHLGGGRAGS